MNDSQKDVTVLLDAVSAGDRNAPAKLLEAVYADLRRLAAKYMFDERGDHTLQATALVHEAFIRLVDWENVSWQNRAHFFAVAARAMRHILVDHARTRQAEKRGGETEVVSLEDVAIISKERAAEVLALDDALENLFALEERKGRVVELRYFGGLSVEETAEVLQVSPETVARDWRFAKTWLLRELSNQ